MNTKTIIFLSICLLSYNSLKPLFTATVTNNCSKDLNVELRVQTPKNARSTLPKKLVKAGSQATIQNTFQLIGIKAYDTKNTQVFNDQSYQLTGNIPITFINDASSTTGVTLQPLPQKTGHIK